MQPTGTVDERLDELGQQASKRRKQARWLVQSSHSVQVFGMQSDGLHRNRLFVIFYCAWVRWIEELGGELWCKWWREPDTMRAEVM